MWGAGTGSSPNGPEGSGERALFRVLAARQAAGEARRSARERRASSSRGRSRTIALLAAAVCFSAFLAVFAGGASAVHDLGLFQLDGNAAVDASPAGEDWNAVVGNGTGSLPLAASTAISATFVDDPYNAPNADSAYGAGSSKDIDDVPSWTYTLAGNVNDKLDFEHAGAALYIAPSGDPILYFFADRYAQNGDAKVGFWFFKGQVGLEPSPGTHFTGPHQNGDILIESDFTNGGANISNIVVKEWQNGALSAPLGTGGDCKTAGQSDELCGTNSTGTFGQLWSFEPKAQSTAGSFFEGGINLATLFGGTDQVPCFSSFLAHSRTSGESADSELKDFVLGQFNTCGTITVIKSATPKDNTSFSFTTTGSSPLGGGFNLSDPGSTTKVFTDVPKGSYSVTEGALANWGLSSVDCTSKGTGTSAPTHQTTPTASITLGYGGHVTCTYTNVHDQGYLKISKVFDPKSSGFAGTFAIKVDCGAGVQTVPVAAGGSATVGPFDTGTQCSVSEPSLPSAPAGWTFGAPQVSGSPATIVASSQGSPGVTVTVTNSISRDQGYLKISKVFDPKSSGFAGTFAIKVDCGAGVQTVPVAAGGSATVGPFDTGTQCSVSEPSLPSAPAGWTFGAPQVSGSPATIVASSQGSPGVTVTVTNSISRDQGYLKISKVFDPKSSGFAGTFAIKVDCGAGVQTVPVAAGGSATVGPFDTGTQCSVSEPSLPSAPAGWTFGAPQVSGSPATIVASSQGSPGVTVTVTNSISRDQGYLKISKVFDPKSSGFAGTFAIKVDCGAGVQTVPVAAGGSATVGPFDTGTQCSVSEPSLPSAPAGWTFGAPQVSGSPATIVASSQGSPGVTVTVTNSISHDTGSLTISKVLTGGPSGYAGPFTIGYDCNDGSAHDGSVSLLAGVTSAPITGIPTGTQCVITEVLPAAPAGYTFQTPTFAPSQTVVITSQGQTINVQTTNTLAAIPPPPSPPPAPKADVAIVKDATSQVTLGSNGKAAIVYDFRILNNGPDSAADVTVADAAPTGVVFDSVTQQPSQGSCAIGNAGALVSCSVGTLAAGQALTFRVAATVSVTGTITNTGTTTTSTPDTNPANNTDSAQTIVVAPVTPPTPKPKPKPAPEICSTLVASPKMVKANGKAQTIKLKVTKGSKGFAGAKIKLSGPGISKTVRTGKNGLAAVSIKPTKPGIIKVEIIGAKACNTQRLGVIGVFEPPVTG